MLTHCNSVDIFSKLSSFRNAIHTSNNLIQFNRDHFRKVTFGITFFLMSIAVAIKPILTYGIAADPSNLGQTSHYLYQRLLFFLKSVSFWELVDPQVKQVIALPFLFKLKQKNAIYFVYSLINICDSFFRWEAWKYWVIVILAFDSIINLYLKWEYIHKCIIIIIINRMMLT